MKKISIPRNASTRVIAYTAVLTAICALLNIFTIQTAQKYFVISFTYIPAFIAGVMINPVAGFMTGFLGDLIGVLIRPLGPYNPIISISSGLLGLIPGVIFQHFKLNNYIKIVISFIVTFVICTAALNTYATFLIYGKGKTFWVYLSLRLPWQSIVVAMNVVIMGALFKPLKIMDRKLTFILSNGKGKGSSAELHTDKSFDVHNVGDDTEDGIHQAAAGKGDNQPESL